MSRAPTCDCNECPKCKRRIYMFDYYRRPGVADKVRATATKTRNNNIDAIRAYDRERGFREYDKDKTRARRKLNHEIEMGRVVKEPCEVCGSEERIHGHHHDDYSKPLDVRWLCAKHHGEVHRVIA